MEMFLGFGMTPLEIETKLRFTQTIAEKAAEIAEQEEQWHRDLLEGGPRRPVVSPMSQIVHLAMLYKMRLNQASEDLAKAEQREQAAGLNNPNQQT